MANVGSGKLDRQPHTILDAWVEPVFYYEQILHPNGEAQRNSGKPHEPTTFTDSA
jgi:hypothetical protein